MLCGRRCSVYQVVARLVDHFALIGIKWFENFYCYLSGPSKFEECLQLIKDHELYVKALGLFSLMSQEYKVSQEVFTLLPYTTKHLCHRFCAVTKKECVFEIKCVDFG